MFELADVFLASHHGLESGFSLDLFEYFKPKLTIVSDDTSATSAADKYSKLSSEWKVHYRNGTSEKRKCLTTRKDGVISVKLGYNQDKKPYLYVRAR